MTETQTQPLTLEQGRIELQEGCIDAKEYDDLEEATRNAVAWVVDKVNFLSRGVNNPKGSNQYKLCRKCFNHHKSLTITLIFIASKEDPILRNRLQLYHTITSNRTLVMEMLALFDNIKIRFVVIPRDCQLNSDALS